MDFPDFFIFWKTVNFIYLILLLFCENENMYQYPYDTLIRKMLENFLKFL